MSYAQRMHSGKTHGRRGNGFGELDLIGRIRAWTAAEKTAGVRLGIGDDCALLRPRTGEDLAVTTDLSIAGRHFRLDWHPPQSVGHRTLARGLSDLAAMGARPLAAFLSLGLPRELVQDGGERNWLPVLLAKNARRTGHGRFFLHGENCKGKPGQAASWVEQFFDGLLKLAQAYGTPLAGGDLAESPVVSADIVLVGAVPRGKALLRSGARAGDMLYVTGSLGGAAAALARLGKLAAARGAGTGARQQRAAKIPEQLEPLLAPHLYPQPRVEQGIALRRRNLATAALDLSDGLSIDLMRLCLESGVAAEVEAAALPVSPGAGLEEALHGGEDYELLFTARPEARVPRSIAGVAVTRIGHMVRAHADRSTVTLMGAEWERPLEARGWEHFA